MNESIDVTQCPVCGESNDCKNVIDDNSKQKACWCENTEYQFPVDLFTRIPAKFKNKSCICESCAQVYRNNN